MKKIPCIKWVSMSVICICEDIFSLSMVMQGGGCRVMVEFNMCEVVSNTNMGQYTEDVGHLHSLLMVMQRRGCTVMVAMSDHRIPASDIAPSLFITCIYSILGNTSFKKKCFLSGIARMRGGGGPCPN